MTGLDISSLTRRQISANPTSVKAPNASETSVRPADLVDEVGKDLGGVLRVDPLLARDGEREDVLRDQLVVVDHPLPGHEVPEDVGIAASAHDHAQDHDEGRDNDELTWCDASELAGDGGGHQAEGYPVPGLGGHGARDGRRAGCHKGPGGGAYLMWSTPAPSKPSPYAS